MKFQQHQISLVILNDYNLDLTLNYKDIILSKTIDSTLANNYKHYTECIKNTKFHF